MSTTRTRLGKIANVTIGNGGYDDAMFGVHFELSFGACGCSDAWASWGPEIKHSPHCNWTDKQRKQSIADAFWRLAETMQQAKVTNAADLKGVPIEVTLEGNSLKSWRILTEVL